MRIGASVAQLDGARPRPRMAARIAVVLARTAVRAAQMASCELPGERVPAVTSRMAGASAQKEQGIAGSGCLKRSPDPLLSERDVLGVQLDADGVSA